MITNRVIIHLPTASLESYSQFLTDIFDIEALSESDGEFSFCLMGQYFVIYEQNIDQEKLQSPQREEIQVLCGEEDYQSLSQRVEFYYYKNQDALGGVQSIEQTVDKILFQDPDGRLWSLSKN